MAEAMSFHRLFLQYDLPARSALGAAGVGCAGLTAYQHRLCTARLLRLPCEGVQNSDDGAVSGEDACCYGHEHCERENENTQQTTQVAAFLWIAAAAIPAFSLWHDWQLPRSLNLPALTLAAVSK